MIQTRHSLPSPNILEIKKKTLDWSLSREGSKQSVKSHIGFSYRTVILEPILSFS
ncbi:unnamed protein product [Brassica rapa subsp. trilocularis]